MWFVASQLSQWVGQNYTPVYFVIFAIVSTNLDVPKTGQTMPWMATKRGDYRHLHTNVACRGRARVYICSALAGDKQAMSRMYGISKN